MKRIDVTCLSFTLKKKVRTIFMFKKNRIATMKRLKHKLFYKQINIILTQFMHRNSLTKSIEDYVD